MINWKNPFGSLRKQPVASPGATKRTVSKPRVTMDDALNAVPAGINLVGKAPAPVVLEGATHTIQLRDSGLLLDGIKYILTSTDSIAFGTDAPLTIFDAHMEGKHLCITTGMGNDKHFLRLDAGELNEMVRQLQRGKAVECPAGDTTVQIARQMY